MLYASQAVGQLRGQKSQPMLEARYLLTKRQFENYTSLFQLR